MRYCGVTFLKLNTAFEKERQRETLGERNDTIWSYLEKPEIFADFFNGSLFDGEVAILPKELNITEITFGLCLITKG